MAAKIGKVRHRRIITWTGTGSSSKVMIEYSNNGSSWNSIASSVSNNGSYNWGIPYLKIWQTFFSQKHLHSNSNSNADFLIDITAKKKWVQ